MSSERKQISYEEAYSKLFSKFTRTESVFRDYEFKGYQRIYTTWPMLEKRIGRKRPTEYQIVSYALAYWAPEPTSPTYRALGAPAELGPEHYVQKWFIYFRDRSPLVKAVLDSGSTWQDFEDPYQIVYWKYNSMMDEEETFVDGLLEQIVYTKHDTMLSEEMLIFYRDYYDPLRFVWHALQMHSAYIAQMAFSSTTQNMFTFMAMDYLRRVQRVAQRIKMLDIVYPNFGFGKKGRAMWEEGPEFQPLRQAIEHMLVAYDITEALTSFALAIKPAVDLAFLRWFGELARRNGEPYLQQIHMSFEKDTQRHRDQLIALFKYAFERAPATKTIVKEYTEKWRKAGRDAVKNFKTTFEGMSNSIPIEVVMEDIENEWNNLDIALKL